MEQLYSIDELAQAADVPVRTVRYYISEGLLPGPGARGRAATYDAAHLARLQLIRRLVEQHVPLAEARARLADLSPAEVESLLRVEQQRDAALRRASESSPRDYISGLLAQAHRAESAPAASPSPQPAAARRARQADGEVTSIWHRWELAPGVELHVRADALRACAALVDEVLHVSRTVTGR